MTQHRRVLLDTLQMRTSMEGFPCSCAGVAQMSVSGNDQSEGVDGAAESAKRLRNLQKKLRQVQQLKEKQGKGEPLEPEQVAKIGSEAGLLAEIQSLGG